MGDAERPVRDEKVHCTVGVGLGRRHHVRDPERPLVGVAAERLDGVDELERVSVAGVRGRFREHLDGTSHEVDDEQVPGGGV